MQQPEERANLISKFKYVWRAVGTEICKLHKLKYIKYEYFNYEEGKKIARPLHFIFVLDHSNSMRGFRWEALVDAFRAFIKQRSQILFARQGKDYLSIIGFTDVS